MHRVYLSEVLPETALIKASLGADVRQKLEAHKKEQKDYKNACPEVTFFPMSKYDVAKIPIEITEKEREEQLLRAGSDGAHHDDVSPKQPGFLGRLKSAAETLPQRARVKARKLLPHLLPFESLLDTENIDLRNILYDLTVEKAQTIKTAQRETLASITRQLESNSQVDKRIFFKKIAEKPQHKASPRTPGHPTKSKSKSWQKLSAGYFSRYKPEDEADGAPSTSSSSRKEATPLKRRKKQHLEWN